MHGRGLLGRILVLGAISVGCAAPAGPGPTTPAGGSRAATTKQIQVGILGDPKSLIYRIDQATAAATPGVESIEELVHAAMSNTGDTGLRPQLAEAVPSLANNLWKLLPNGQMETTWTIRQGAHWQDGTPFTTRDLLFTAAVSQERSSALFYDQAYESVESVKAVDDRTLSMAWKKPYIYADQIFTHARELAPILPAHLLEASYPDHKADMETLLFWSDDFVGMGPYRVREWLKGSYMTLEASNDYVLGRPIIDQIAIKFIPDPSTLVARVLSGDIEMTLGRGISVEQSLELRERWPDGNAYVPLKSWQMIVPQFTNSKPAVVADLRFRRALLYAMDRETLSVNLQGGLIPVAHGFLSPENTAYKDTEQQIVRYEYDPLRAAQAIEGLGFSKGADGYFHDSSGQRLSLELWTNAGDDFRDRLQLAIADQWQRAGIEVGIVRVPQQQLTDRAYRAQFPALQIQRRDNELGDWEILHSSKIPLPENNFVGLNIARYPNQEMDALIEKYNVTIPIPERIAVAGQIVHHISDQLPFMGVLYSTEPVLVGKRIKNVNPKKFFRSTHAWNSEQWDVV